MGRKWEEGKKKVKTNRKQNINKMARNRYKHFSSQYLDWLVCLLEYQVKSGFKKERAINKKVEKQNSRKKVSQEM